MVRSDHVTHTSSCSCVQGAYHEVASSDPFAFLAMLSSTLGTQAQAFSVCDSHERDTPTAKSSQHASQSVRRPPSHEAKESTPSRECDMCVWVCSLSSRPAARIQHRRFPSRWCWWMRHAPWRCGGFGPLSARISAATCSGTVKLHAPPAYLLLYIYFLALRSSIRRVRACVGRHKFMLELLGTFDRGCARMRHCFGTV